MGVLLLDWIIDRSLMQLGIISLRFKFLNPPGSLIISVLLFTLTSSSLNENRAIEHCAMKYISIP